MEPYLSVVAVSRNDDHGGDPLIRTQHFVDCFALQCEAFGLSAELVIVDWNPVEGRPFLIDALDSSVASGRIDFKSVVVPNEVHKTLRYAEQLPLYQMIGKNVGIRRARGEFVLATNIDILFSEELMRFIATQELDESLMYRCARVDTDTGVPQSSDWESRIDYAWKNILRINGRSGMILQEKWKDSPEWLSKFCNREKKVVQIPDDKSFRPHTMACGDFTMLSKSAWKDLRGYGEFDAYSWHIDSILCYQAFHRGIREYFMSMPACCFHIEHSAGSGWTPEGEAKLFSRLSEAGIDYFNDDLLKYLDLELESSKGAPLNNENWGAIGQDLEVISK